MGAARRAGRVFVDTSGFFAVANRRDASHHLAATAMEELVRASHRLFTTNFVLAELHALLVNRLDRRVAAQVLMEIDTSSLTTIVRVSARDERRAREIVLNYRDKDFSLTDATSFAVMERLHIRHALTLDQDFVQFGWSVLPVR